MRINFNAEIKGLKGEDILGDPLIPAEQLSVLVMSDRGESVKSAREAFQLTALVERIAVAKGPIDVSEEEVTLLETVLDNALKGKVFDKDGAVIGGKVSTFLAGRLYGILEGQASSSKATKKGKNQGGD